MKIGVVLTLEDIFVVNIVLLDEPVLLLGELVDKVALLVPARFTPEEVEAVLVGAVGGLELLASVHELIETNDRQQSRDRVIISNIGVVAVVVGELEVVGGSADEQLCDVSVLTEEFV